VQHFEPSKGAMAEESPIETNDTVLRILKTTKGVKTIQAFATKNAVIKGAESIEFVLLKGVEKKYDFGNMQSFLQQGRWIHFPDSGYSNEINLSKYTASQLKLKVNDKVLLYFIQPDGSRRVRQLKVAGIFKTGIEDFDKLSAIGDLRLIQRLNNWPASEFGGYEVFVDDYTQLDSINNRIFEQLPNTWNSRTIRDVYPNIFDWLNLQNTTIAIVIIIMIVVAVLNLITCLIILLLERTRMVGILKALGGSNGIIQRIFLFQGALITIVGILLGDIITLLVCWLQQRYEFLKLPEDAYFISTAVVKLEPWHVAVVNAGTFLVCFLLLTIPTFIIRRIQPLRAILFR
jgi:lipoprotein-releasing system permease protein